MTADRARSAARRHHHGRQRPLGDAARPAALRRPSRRRRGRAPGGRGRARPRHHDAHAVRVLVRQLAPPRPGGRRADGAAAALSARRAARLVDNGVRLTVIGRRDRLPDGLGEDIAGAEQRLGGRVAPRICGSRSTTPRATPSPTRPRAGSPTQPPSREAFGRLLAGRERRRQRRRRSPHPHRRRKAAVGFPAVGIRLRRALLPRHAVARLRRRRPARRDRRFPSPRAPLRRASTSVAQLTAAE